MDMMHTVELINTTLAACEKPLTWIDSNEADSTKLCIHLTLISIVLVSFNGLNFLYSNKNETLGL